MTENDETYFVVEKSKEIVWDTWVALKMYL